MSSRYLCDFILRLVILIGILWSIRVCVPNVTKYGLANGICIPIPPVDPIATHDYFLGSSIFVFPLKFDIPQSYGSALSINIPEMSVDRKDQMSIFCVYGLFPNWTRTLFLTHTIPPILL